MLLTTQYLEEADALADEISVIDHGRVIAHGTPHELKQIVGGQTPAGAARPTRPGWPTSRRDPDRGRRDRAGVARAAACCRCRCDGDAALTEAVARLAAEGIAVTELSLRLPSLDEVFFALTGAPATSDDEEDAA